MSLKKTVSVIALSSLALAACSGGDSTSAATGTTVKLGVVGAVYEEIWTPAKDLLAEQGITLEFVQFDDYALPNNALASGDIDLNAFQHVVYLESEVEANGYEIEPFGYTFIIPLNLYSDGKVTSVDQIKAGDTIAYPNDPTNGGRALKVLEAAGLLTLTDDAGFNPTADDVVSTSVDFELLPLKANTIQPALPDVTAGFVNGNFAQSAGLDPSTAVYQDQKLADTEYWNVIVGRTDDLNDPEKKELYQTVVDAFQSTATEELFDGEFNGFFIPVGWDEDLLN